MRRGLVVRHIENPGRFSGKRGADRLGNIPDVDAVEGLAVLDDAPRLAACDLHQRILAGAGDSGETKHCNGAAGRSPKSSHDCSAAARARLRGEFGSSGVCSSTQAPS